MALVEKNRLAWLALAFAGQTLVLYLGNWLSRLGWEPALLGPIALGWTLAVGCWWGAWLALHEGRGWTPWLETLTVMTATYGPAIAIHWAYQRAQALFFPADTVPAGDELKLDIDLDPALAYFLALAMISLVEFFMAARLVRLFFGYRITFRAASPRVAQQANLRGILLLVALFGLHLALLTDFAHTVIGWEWAEVLEWHLTQDALRVAVFVLPVALVFVGALRCILGPAPRGIVSVAWVAAGTLGVGAGSLFFNPSGDGWSSVGFCLGVAANALVFGGLLRWLGYEIAGRNQQP